MIRKSVTGRMFESQDVDAFATGICARIDAGLIYKKRKGTHPVKFRLTVEGEHPGIPKEDTVNLGALIDAKIAEKVRKLCKEKDDTISKFVERAIEDELLREEHGWIE